MTPSDDLSLDRRAQLPDALRVLLDSYPRDGWAAHPHFTGLVQFWLERHQMFRQLLDVMDTDAQAALGGDLDPRTHAARLSRFGGMLVSQLHGHHQIEDGHYFPLLAGLEPGLARGFDLLDRDHDEMDGYLKRFTEAANGVLGGADDPAALRDLTGAFHGELAVLTGLLDRHLTDEEEIVVPVILKSGGGGLG